MSYYASNTLIEEMANGEHENDDDYCPGYPDDDDKTKEEKE